MKRRIYGLLSVAAIATLGFGCKEDPLADSGGSLSRVDLQYTYREVIIADSVQTFAIERDALNTPLPPTATIRSCNTAIATVRLHDDAPQQRTGFFIKGVTYGTTCVIAEAGSLADTMQVATFPASIAITGPDSIGSGAVSQFSWQYRDRVGNPVTGVPVPAFKSSDTTRAKPLPTPLGAITAFSPGLVTLSVTGTGSPADGVTNSKGVTVVPGTFLGGITPSSGDPTDTVKLTNAVGGPGFDSDTRVVVNNADPFILSVTTDSLKLIVPGIGAVGSVVVGLTNLGAAQVAQNGTFTSNTASFADPYDAVNDDATTAPVITANGDYYIVMSGGCSNGGGGAGTDCDDWFRVTNPGGTAATVTVRVDWFTGADVDVLMGTDPVDVYNYGCEDGCGGATGVNPQTTSLSVPAAATKYVWVNLYDAGGAASTLIRVRVSGLP